MINYLTMILQMNGGTPGICSQMMGRGAYTGAIKLGEHTSHVPFI